MKPRKLPEFAGLWAAVERLWQGLPAVSAETDGQIEAAAERVAPVVWLVGKVQSGKSSIVRVVTGSPDAEVGAGYKACTRTARVFDFPTEAPLLRFLDTRGLGEAAYDPNEDLRVFQGRSHLVIGVMRALDAQQSAIVDVLRAVRAREPDCPVIIAQTTLHEAYGPGDTHRLPYPFAESADDADLIRRGVQADLVRALAHQRGLFAAVARHKTISFVPIDFTLTGDGFEPASYGLDALAEVLMRHAPAAMTAALDALPGIGPDHRRNRAKPVIMGHATAAAGSDLVPVAGALAVPAIQARLLQRLATQFGQRLDKRAYSELAAAIGTGSLARMLSGFGIRQLAKLLPGYGQTAAAAGAAASSFAITYALGLAAVYFFERRRAGIRDDAGVAAVYAEGLREAFSIARQRTGTQRAANYVAGTAKTP